MAQFIIQKTTLEDIAFAIRKKENSTDTMLVSEIANRIHELEGENNNIMALTAAEILAICK